MVYDTVVIGAGPAGLTSAIYLARSGWNVIVLDRLGGGGQASTTEMIYNYPGFPEGVEGPRLMDLMLRHARAFGARVEMGEVSAVRVSGEGDFTVSGEAGDYEAKSVIFAAGTSPRKLGVPGEERLIGRGVSFCATCDGPLFSGKRVAVVGGGDSALTEAQFLARLASEVLLIHRRDEFRASLYNQKAVKENSRITLRMSTVVEDIHGERFVEAVTLRDLKSGRTIEEAVSAVFVYAGSFPNTAPVMGLVDTDEDGYIIAGPDMSTKTPGLFVAGDVRRKVLRQVSTAVGDGAVAAFSSESYLLRLGR